MCYFCCALKDGHVPAGTEFGVLGVLAGDSDGEAAAEMTRS